MHLLSNYVQLRKISPSDGPQKLKLFEEIFFHAENTYILHVNKKRLGKYLSTVFSNLTNFPPIQTPLE